MPTPPVNFRITAARKDNDAPFYIVVSLESRQATEQWASEHEIKWSDISPASEESKRAFVSKIRIISLCLVVLVLASLIPLITSLDFSNAADVVSLASAILFAAVGVAIVALVARAFGKPNSVTWIIAMWIAMLAAAGSFLSTGADRLSHQGAQAAAARP